jgi:hypothetical protein
MNHAIHGFVDGPVATQDQNQAGAGRHGFAGDSSRVAGSSGWSELQLVPLHNVRASERFSGTL